MTRDVKSGTAMQESTFWVGMEKALDSIIAETSSTGVKLTVESWTVKSSSM